MAALPGVHRDAAALRPQLPASTRTSALSMAYRLSLGVLVLAAAAAAVGLFVPHFYRDNDWTRPQLRGGDLVTLAVGVPLLAGSLWSALHGSLRGRLLWLGALGYMAYGYLYYLVAVAFNPLFLVYVGVVALSLYALVLGLASLDWDTVAARFRGISVRAVQVFLLLIGAVLGLMWGGLALAASIAGDVPKQVTESGHPTAVVFALDLTLIVPLALAAAYGLGRRQAWGYVAAAVMLIKAAAYGLALLAMGLFAYRAGQDVSWFLEGLWALVAAGGVILAVRYFAPLGRGR